MRFSRLLQAGGHHGGKFVYPSSVKDWGPVPSYFHIKERFANPVEMSWSFSPYLPPRNNKFLVYGFGDIGPWLLGSFALSAAVWSWNFYYLRAGSHPHSAEWLAEAERIGNVVERVNGPPVFLNPMRNRIPGYITGPEDLKSKDD